MSEVEPGLEFPFVSPGSSNPPRTGFTLRRFLRRAAGPVVVRATTFGVSGALIWRSTRVPLPMRVVGVLSVTYTAFIALFLRLAKIAEDLLVADFLAPLFRSDGEAIEHARAEHGNALRLLAADQAFWVFLRGFAAESAIGHPDEHRMRRIAPDAGTTADAYADAYGRRLQSLVVMHPEAGQVADTLAAAISPTPVIALGNLAEAKINRDLAASVVRLYRPVDDWQAAAALIDRALAIAVFVGSEPSDGVQWELREIVARNRVDRTLVIGLNAGDTDWTGAIHEFPHRYCRADLDAAAKTFLAQLDEG